MSKLTDDLDPGIKAHEAYDAAQQDTITNLNTEVHALNEKVYDLERQLAEATKPQPPVVPPTPVKAAIGASWDPSKYPLPTIVKTLATARHFFQPGDMTKKQSWANEKKLTEAYTRYGARIFSISFKPDTSSGSVAFKTPANIEAFLDTIPKDIRPEDVLLTFYHEHDGNIRDGSLSLALYKNGGKTVADIAHKRGHLYGPIHNGMVYDAKRTPKWGLYSNIWAANESNVEDYDFWGVDCYSENYEAPSPRMDAIKTYADSLKLPVLIGEMAAPINDPVKQAAWAKDARVWALKNAKWAHWWNAQVSANLPDWRMTDATAKAWFSL